MIIPKMLIQFLLFFEVNSGLLPIMLNKNSIAMKHPHRKVRNSYVHIITFDYFYIHFAIHRIRHFDSRFQ